MEENTSSGTIANEHHVIIGDAWDFGGGKYLFVMYYPSEWTYQEVGSMKRMLDEWSEFAPSIVESGGAYLIRDDLYLEIRKVVDVK